MTARGAGSRPASETPAQTPNGVTGQGLEARGRVERAAAKCPSARRIIINRDWCKGCGICVSVCPRDVLAIDQTAWTGGFHPVIVVRPERCTVCRICELLCPDLAIEVFADE